MEESNALTLNWVNTREKYSLQQSVTSLFIYCKFFDKNQERFHCPLGLRKLSVIVQCRARHCDSLVANATKYQALATTFLELVASGRLTFTFFLHPFNLKGK